VPGDGRYFLTDAAGKTHRFDVKGIPQPISINGPWRLTLGSNSPLPLEQLQSWNDLPEGKDYSGWATYETEFELPSLGEQMEWELELGDATRDRGSFSEWNRSGKRLEGLPNPAVWESSEARNEPSESGSGKLWIHHVHSLPQPDRKALALTFGIRWGTYGEIDPGKLPPPASSARCGSCRENSGVVTL